MSYSKHKLILISGPSGVGKDTVKKRIFEKSPDVFEETISCTTRAKRPGEINGINYHFLTRQEFEEKIHNQEFLEWAEYAGNYYGTLKSEIERIVLNKKIPVAVIEVQGVLQIKNNLTQNERLSVFIMPESINQLKQQIADRNQEMSVDELNRRMIIAQQEIQIGQKEFDFQVVNKYGQLNQTVDEVLRLIKF